MSVVDPDFPRNIPEVEALLAENQRLRDLEEAARAISQWDANLIRPQCPPGLMNALDQALNEVDRGREALAGDEE